MTRAAVGKMEEMAERRADPRHTVRLTTTVARASERRLPAATTIDISTVGILLAFGEPVGLRVDDKVVLSIAFPAGRFHCLGRVRRVERGSDFRTYAGVQFELCPGEERQLSERLALLGDAGGGAASRRGSRSIASITDPTPIAASPGSMTSA